MVFSRTHLALLCGVLYLFLSGCGGPASVTGSVKLDGQPVTGHIVFIPSEDSRPKRGGPVENGSFDIAGERGPVPGKYRVEIYARKRTGRKTQGVDAEQTTDETVEMIPAKFNVDSTLTSEVKRGENRFDFELSSK